MVDRIQDQGSDNCFPTIFNLILDVDEIDSVPKHELCETAIELLFTGHDTIASGLCSALMFLGKHKECLEKVRGELEDHGYLEVTSDFDFRRVHSLPYLNCVVKEILRLAPPAGAGFRKVLKTFELGVSTCVLNFELGVSKCVKTIELGVGKCVKTFELGVSKCILKFEFGISNCLNYRITQWKC